MNQNLPPLERKWKIRDETNRYYVRQAAKVFLERWAKGRTLRRVSGIQSADGWINAVLIECEPGGEAPTFSATDIDPSASLLPSHPANYFHLGADAES